MGVVIVVIVIVIVIVTGGKQSQLLASAEAGVWQNLVSELKLINSTRTQLNC